MRFVTAAFDAVVTRFGLNGSSERTADDVFRGATPAATLHSTSPAASIQLTFLPLIISPLPQRVRFSKHSQPQPRTTPAYRRRRATSPTTASPSTIMPPGSGTPTADV
jgi:hypothetical protein